MKANIFFGVSFTILVLTIISACDFTEDKRENMLDVAMSDAQRINERSYFGEYKSMECKLLAIDDAGRVAMPHPLGDSTKNGCFYFFPFGDNICITQIALRSDEHHIFGIRVGDSFSGVERVLEEDGYLKRSNVIPHELSYKKGYIIISFEADENSSEITEIIITATDPQYEGISY